MSYLWGSMILIGIVYGMCTGNITEVTQAVIKSSEEAVSLCLGMAGITAFWNGLMKIAEESGWADQENSSFAEIFISEVKFEGNGNEIHCGEYDR